MSFNLFVNSNPGSRMPHPIILVLVLFFQFIRVGITQNCNTTVIGTSQCCFGISNLDISNDKVLFEESTFAGDFFLYWDDLQDGKQLIYSGSFNVNPFLSGRPFDYKLDNDIVVWQAMQQIFKYDGGTTTQVSDPISLVNSTPDIDNSTVVWSSGDPADLFSFQIFKNDGSGIEPVSNNTSVRNINPAISNGWITWNGQTSPATMREQIFLDSGSGPVQISDPSVQYGLPYIDGQLITYLSFGFSDPNGPRVFMNDGSTQTAISTPSTTPVSEPRVSGNTIVWVADIGSNQRIVYKYQNGTLTPVSAMFNGSPGGVEYVDISGGRIVWIQDQHIYMNDGVQTIQLSLPGTNPNNLPTAGEQRIAWTGNNGFTTYSYDCDASPPCEFSTDTTFLALDIHCNSKLEAPKVLDTCVDSLLCGTALDSSFYFTQGAYNIGWKFTAADGKMDTVFQDINVDGVTVCDTASSGIGSLSNAFDCAEAGDTIDVLGNLMNDTLVLDGTGLTIDVDVVLSVDTADNVTIDATNVGSAFTINNGSTLTLDGLTIIGGNADDGGVAINNGILNIANCTFGPHMGSGGHFSGSGDTNINPVTTFNQ